MLVNIFCLFFFSLDISRAAKVPIIVAIIEETNARISELKKAVKITLSLKSSTNHFSVNPLKIVLDFVLLHAKTTTTKIGVYKNKKTNKKQSLDIIFLIIFLNSPFLFYLIYELKQLKFLLIA